MARMAEGGGRLGGGDGGGDTGVEDRMVAATAAVKVGDETEVGRWRRWRWRRWRPHTT